MGFCQKFKVPLVLCDEIFYLEDTRTFDAGQPIDEGATVSGTVTLNVTECDIVVVDNLITANLEITVQKELTVNQEDPFELEFMYPSTKPSRSGDAQLLICLLRYHLKTSSARYSGWSLTRQSQLTPRPTPSRTS